MFYYPPMLQAYQYQFNQYLKSLLLLCALLLGPIVVQAQSTIFKETVGAKAPSSVTAYQTSNSFDNNTNGKNLTMSGGGNVKNTTPSNYPGASGTNNIDNGTTFDFQISGINTLDYTDLKLGFGVNIGARSQIKVEYSVDGTVWQSLGYSLPAPGSGWSYMAEQISGTIPATSNLRVRFTSSPNGSLPQKVLIDDIQLTGTSSSPVITSFSPASGGIDTEVTVYGKNLKDARLVYFETAGVTADAYGYESGNEVKFRVPADATTDFIQLYTENATAYLATSAEQFVVITPTISSFTPNSGSPKPIGIPGTEVIITGTNLATANAVVFGGVGRATPHFTSETQIKVYVPDDAATGALVVETTAYGNATSSTNFTVLKPSITSLNSTTGAAKSTGKVGETLVIKGQRLNVAPFSVTFRGAGSTSITATVTASSATELRVTVPSGAQTGPVTVTTDEGTATSSNFTILTPTITFQDTPLAAFATKPGVASQSQSYKISGSNLDGGINITAPTNFQVSSDNINWGGPVFLPINGNGAVALTQIYVRYLPAAKGTHSGNVDNTSVNLTRLVAVQGATLDPTITVTGTLVEFSAVMGQSSESQTYTVSGSNMEGGILISAPAEFEVSKTNSTFSPQVTIDLPGGATSIASTTVYIRYRPTSTGPHSGNTTHASQNATTVPLAASGNTAGPLPVELTYFKAINNLNEVTLLWATASEKDNSHFEIEMATNPKADFTKIAEVKSKSVNSSITTNYSLAYAVAGPGVYYFRLKQVDLDGTSSYSKIVAVENRSMIENKATVSPNPLNYNSKLFVTAAGNGRINLTLHNTTGKRLFQRAVDVKAGQNEIQLPLYEKLNRGIYILTIEMEGQRLQVKVVKQ